MTMSNHMDSLYNGTVLYLKLFHWLAFFWFLYVDSWHDLGSLGSCCYENISSDNGTVQVLGKIFFLLLLFFLFFVVSNLIIK